MSKLGLKYNDSQNSLTFDLEVSEGEAENVRLDSPQAWIPLNMNESFVQVNLTHNIRALSFNSQNVFINTNAFVALRAVALYCLVILAVNSLI